MEGEGRRGERDRNRDRKIEKWGEAEKWGERQKGSFLSERKTEKRDSNYYLPCFMYQK